MSDTQIFEGDLHLEDTPDGGDIRFEHDIFVSDHAFNTAVYLSLFGGNKDDTGKVKNNKEWWGNTLLETSPAEKMSSRFQSVIRGLPMTTKNIQEAENAAKLDLVWLIAEGIADEINTDGQVGQGNKFFLRIDIKASGKNIYDNTFSIFWKAGIYGGI